VAPLTRCWASRALAATFGPARAVLVLALVLAALAHAAVIEVDGGDDPDSRLEFRTITLPDGTTTELIVLEGNPIVVTVDGRQRFEGRLIEFDPAARIIRIVGPGVFETEEQRIEGVDLEIALDDEALRGRDVLVVLSEIDVWGLSALRLPGQVDVRGGLFSPCARCGQAVWDYGFRASSLRIFPGDRLVAEGVTLLVRDAGILWFPLLVFPLAEGDRQPVLRIDAGSAARRAVVQLRWPYVAGPNALGTFTVRYEADVDPADATGLTGRILGGAVRASYLGGDLDHRFFTDTGSGRVTATYRPAFRDPARPDGRTAPLLGVVARFDTDATLALPSVTARLLRDDSRQPGRWEYTLGLVGESDGWRGRYDSQGFVDAPTAVAGSPAVDPLAPPSYADRATPRRTLSRLQVEPVTLEGLRVGGLRLDALGVDLGAFVDASNPANRRAAVRALADGGRLLVRHGQTLAPTPLWSGASLDGRNTFEGRYYDSGERLVRWRTIVALTQSFGRLGSATIAFDRDVNEGETPFRFDVVPLRNRMEATARLVLTPTPWLSAESRSGYTFVDTRRPELVGWQDLDSRLRLFGDLAWLDVDVRHRALLAEGDPGTVDATLTLQTRAAPSELRIVLQHLQDLRPEPSPLGLVADTRTALSARIAVDRVVAFELIAAHRPLAPVLGDGTRRAWDPLDLRVALGSFTERDTRPGARAQLLLDAATGRTTRLQLDARVAFGEVEIDAFQRYDAPALGVVGGSPGLDSRLRVRWFGHLTAELRGALLLPPERLGLEPGGPRTRQLTLQLRDAPLSDAGRWELTGRTTLDPTVAGGAAGRRNTALEGRLAVVQERLGPVDLSVDGTMQWLLADDALPRSYLQRAAVVIGADIAGRVGVQGSMAYVATYAPATDTFTRSELAIDRLSLTVRATEALFVGARISDVWDFTRTRADRSPWNLQPELYVLWDRCCWAAAASWNTATGAVRFVLTGPGGDTGLEQIVGTPLTLPRRPLGAGDAP
jgi:hypothetical protein